MKYSGRKKIYFKADFTSGADFSLDEVRDGKSGADLSGFDYSDGSLKKGYGIASCELGEAFIDGLWLYRKDGGIPMWAKNGTVKYSSKEIGNVSIAGMEVVGETRGINLKHRGVDTVLIFSEGGKLYWWNGEDAPKASALESVTSVEVYDSRVFASVRGSERLYYSTMSNPIAFAESSGGGYLDLSDDRGGINRLISFSGNLFVFKDYGIVRISERETGGFSVHSLYLEGGRIYPDTICLCGDVIVFMTDSGFYRFNGSSVKPVMKEIFSLVLPSANASAAYHDGKYFLAAESSEGTVLICYDFSCVTLTRNIGIKKLYPMGDRLCCLSNAVLGEIAKTGSYFGNPLPKRWVSSTMDFGTSRIKCLRSVLIGTSCPVTLTVTADGVTRSYDMDESRQEVALNLRGKRISFGIHTTQTEVCISPPIVCYSVV